MRVAIDNWVNKNEEIIMSTYHYLHQHPEISWEERETTKFLSSQLDELKLSYDLFETMTGLVGEWGTSDVGRTVAVRADMDALWQHVNGEWKANHSCGHDAHMTIVLLAVRCLLEIGYEPKGLLKVIFQPAEETGKGAKALIRNGVLQGVERLLGIHLRPLQELPIHTASPAIYHGATTLLKGKIKGVQSHGARPHLGINVVDSLAAIVHAVNAVKMDPTISYSAKVTVLKAGEQNINIVPDYGEFGIDLRAQSNEVMQQLMEKVEHAVIAAGSMNGAEVTIDVEAEMVAATPSPQMENIVGSAITEALGEKNLMEASVTPGGEDYHFYSKEYPSLESTMIGLGAGLEPGLHHPHMTFEESTLLDGVKIVSLAIIKMFEE
ncbi:M20 peptidase aminoacylase family protein [Evansella cellulosilytica]|uniref:Amidohydrolase n=1 Tax=Evansella cellulosilytica (strain ATCC 21833 / DSM 2522 / FERM P-1141 / JCM 9156 / N-4) TaxID=649639 RepID=E6TT26_EVAC2|nr:M20 peptidase aminoacylase family protein [Evansella cellulosilytica]ADU31934.1 amidohydrolase [Evansella cellulosilytica DSM 2522]